MISTSTLRILEPSPNILAFYDGRIAGKRLHSSKWNWLDDAAYKLGIASYAVVDGSEALVYDTSISLDHARLIRGYLERRGVTSIRVVLSHHHKDHVAGGAVFADCEVIAGRRTATALAEKEVDYSQSDPPISSLIVPSTVFENELELRVGTIDIELRSLEIHSHDGVALLLPQSGQLLAGDALEDSATYVAEPERLEVHLNEIDRLSTWGIGRILPCHGDPERIALGGYDTSFIDATKQYTRKLLRCPDDEELTNLTLWEFSKDSFEDGSLIYFEDYEAVHKDNVNSVIGHS